MKWREIPVYARRYIIYHTIVSPLLIIWYMLPLYMFMTGYNVLDVGIFFTVVNTVAIPVTYVLGKVFDKVSIRHGLVLIDVLDGVAAILYSLASGVIAPIMLFLGRLIEKISGLLYPLYQAAEKVLYPRDRLEEVFAWHMRLPELSQLFGFLILGYIFGYIFNEPIHYRIGFLAIGLSSVFTIIYLLKALPKMDVKERIKIEKFTFKIDSEFKIILLIEALSTLAWALAPNIVLLNYIINYLGYTLFEVMVVEAAISLGAILATYVTERITGRHRYKMISIGYGLITLWALLMILNPPFIVVVLAYFISRFGDTLAFPYYRAWLFSKVPANKASSVFAAISSYRRVIALISPFLAGFLASIYPLLPYLFSLPLFASVTLILFIISSK